MRFSFAVAVVLAGLSVSGLAQQNGQFKVKKSPPEKAPRSIPMGNASGSSASNANAKALQSAERQSSKANPSAKAAAPKTAKAQTIKPVKDKPNAPINFGETGGGKKVGMVNQGPNPYKGRLKQKHATPN